MRKRYITLLLLAAVLLSGCDTWLDVKPSTELDRSDLFSSESGYADALAGVYANMTSTALYGKNLSWYMLDLMAGYYNLTGMTGTNLTLSEYSYKHSDEERVETIIAMVDSVWSKTYTQIGNLNSILETIDEHKNIFSGNNYKVIKGEALGLRAFLHFDLLRMFAPAYATGKDSLCIPYVTALTTKVTPLVSLDSALTLVMADLDASRELLQDDPMRLGTTPSTILASLPSGAYSTYVEDWHNRRFHFNYFAATATLARVALWKGDKTKALEAAEEIIAAQTTRFPWVKTENLTTIESTYKNQDRTFATEQIFALNIRKEVMKNNLDGYLLMENVTSSENILDANEDLFEGYTSDPRFQYNITRSSGYDLLTKFYQSNAVYAFFQERLPLIRLAEMYYIAAECTTDKGTAVGYLNQVRTHRGLSSSLLPTNLSDTDLTTEIGKEIRKECFGEGQMWFYYKRTGATSIPGMPKFTDTNLYRFDRPDTEDLYGNR